MCFGAQGAKTESDRETVRVMGWSCGFTFDDWEAGERIDEDFSELNSSRDLARLEWRTWGWGMAPTVVACK